MGIPRKKDVVIYTDGSCIGNPGPGGWAAIVVRDGRVEEYGGAEAPTTNNRMEMRAAVEGLRRAEAGERVHVVTDSRYLLDGISKWIRGWKRRGWRKADGGEVLNRDLWEALDRLCSRPDRPVTWEHVRGHAGHAFNERCDEIANGFARGAPPKLRAGDGSWIPADDPNAPGDACRAFPLYVSVADGLVAVHDNWPECEARIKGAKGGRCKKVKTPAEYQRVVAEWEGG